MQVTSCTEKGKLTLLLCENAVIKAIPSMITRLANATDAKPKLLPLGCLQHSPCPARLVQGYTSLSGIII